MEGINLKRDYKKERVGETKISKFGSLMEIVEYKGNNDITVRFIDHDYIVKSAYKEFKSGSIKSAYDKFVHGVGYRGEGGYTSANDSGKITSQYRTWNDMLSRCYNERYKNRQPTYIGCTVAEEWHNFQNFAKWYDENYYEIEGEQMQLDKDILVKGNKVYSPETCVFVPRKINALFVKTNKLRGDLPIGVSFHKSGNRYRATCNDSNGKHVFLGHIDDPIEGFNKYKMFKEKTIKEVADKYKDKIPEKLYKAIYSYKVEITD